MRVEMRCFYWILKDEKGAFIDILWLSLRGELSPHKKGESDLLRVDYESHM